MSDATEKVRRLLTLAADDAVGEEERRTSASVAARLIRAHGLQVGPAAQPRAPEADLGAIQRDRERDREQDRAAGYDQGFSAGQREMRSALAPQFARVLSSVGQVMQSCGMAPPTPPPAAFGAGSGYGSSYGPANVGYSGAPPCNCPNCRPIPVASWGRWR